MLPFAPPRQRRCRNCYKLLTGRCRMYCDSNCRCEAEEFRRKELLGRLLAERRGMRPACAGEGGHCARPADVEERIAVLTGRVEQGLPLFGGK